MVAIHVLLNSIDKVKNFINIASLCKGDLDLSTGRYVVDAKSIMGIFSLDISDPLTLNVYEEEDLALLQENLAEYIVE